MAFFKIKQIALRCGCKFVEGDRRKIIKRVDSFATNYEYACRKHGKILSLIEQWVIRGEVVSESLKSGNILYDSSSEALKSGVKFLREDNAVTSFLLNCGDIEYESTKMFALALKNNYKLTTLHLNQIEDNNWYPKITKALMIGIMKNNSLKSLIIRSFSYVALMPLFTAISVSKSITCLKMDGCSFFYKDAKALALAIKESDALVELFLLRMDILKEGLGQIMCAVKNSHTIEKFVCICCNRKINARVLALMIKNTQY